MMGGTGVSWTICKSFAPCSRQITMAVPAVLVLPAGTAMVIYLERNLTSQFLQIGCPSCRPTNSIKSLKLYASNIS